MSKRSVRIVRTVVLLIIAVGTIAAAWAKLAPPSLEPRVMRLETIVEQLRDVPGDVEYIKGQIDILVDRK